MNNNNYKIRLEKAADYSETENLVREAFRNVYRPGCMEHYVLNQLRNDKDFVPGLDFVMEKDGRIIGQIIFMRAERKAEITRSAVLISEKARLRKFRSLA